MMSKPSVLNASKISAPESTMNDGSGWNDGRSSHVQEYLTEEGAQDAFREDNILRRAARLGFRFLNLQS